MPLNISQSEPVERPTIGSGRGGTGELEALATEVAPLVQEAMNLPADKALPVVVPSEETANLVRALRVAGEKAGVSIRFKRFPRLDASGEQVIKIGDDGTLTKFTVPWEPATKNGSKVRVTFWTTRKIMRPRPVEMAID